MSVVAVPLSVSGTSGGCHLEHTLVNHKGSYGSFCHSCVYVYTVVNTFVCELYVRVLDMEYGFGPGEYNIRYIPVL